jgi:hypothetical protein
MSKTYHGKSYIPLKGSHAGSHQTIKVLTFLPSQWLIDWCLMPMLAVFQLYHGITRSMVMKYIYDGLIWRWFFVFVLTFFFTEG